MSSRIVYKSVLEIVKRIVFLTALTLPAAAQDPLSRLNESLAAGEARLEHEPGGRGYLRSLLRALEIPESSQTLVFSKTSAQFRLIHPGNPRALYFNDDVYVGWVPGGPFLEVSAADPSGSAVFYTLDQTPVESPRLSVDSGQCLQCHDSARTDGVPGHLVRSVFPDPEGQPLFSAGSTDVDPGTPVPERWGGWYASGAEHVAGRANAVFSGLDQVRAYEQAPYPTPAELAERFDVSAYLSPHSDPVALLVLTHQVRAHNRIARAGVEARRALAYREEMTKIFGEASESMLASVRRRIEGPAEDLVRALLFVDEAPLEAPVEPVSSFAEEFQKRGPFDSRGRSLRQFDLNTRLLKHPCSYLIYSDAFHALPDEVKAYVRRRFDEILSGRDDDPAFARLSAADRAAIREITAETGVWR